MLENRWELDGGQSGSTTITLPGAPGYPNYSFTFPSKNMDDDLGSSALQFIDPISTIYKLFQF